ncbi:MAG: hypothetical protein ACOYIG_09430 [Acetivibrionales bacterium]|jgi:hypothetical protein|nr:hypothetical protein [Clostridiaceae bacterium]
MPSNYISALIGFKDKRSTYEKVYRNESKLRIYGICYIHDIPMKYYLNQQSNRTLFRGRISIISPADGQILQMRGKNRREKISDLKQRNSPILDRTGRQEAFNATSELYVNTFNDEEIKRHIEKAALKLFAKYEPSIRIIQKEIGQSAKSTALTALMLYLDDFERKIYASLRPKTRKSKRCALKRVAAYVSSVPMGEVTQAMLKAYAREHSKTAKSDLLVARHFWDFCKKKRVFNNENPLDVYFDSIIQHKRKVNPGKAVQRATELTCLPTVIESKLNQIIASNINNGEYIGLLLVKECGIPAKLVCESKWKEIIFNKELDYVSIIIRKDELAGAIHNYTRPLTPFAASILTNRYTELLKTYSMEQLQEMYVASRKNDPERPLEPKALTTLCRISLIQCGIDHNNLTTVSGELHGSGIRLLLRNIKYRLEHYCGLSQDPAAVRFLLLMALNDVTAENYRSFTCPEGQAYLYNALKRDTRFIETHEPNSSEEVIKELLPDGRVKYTILPESPDKLTSFKVKFLLQPHTRIEVFAPQGLTCSIKTSRTAENPLLYT